MVRSKWSSTIFHEPVGDDRNRDIFPLPYLAVDDFNSRRVCRSVSRRLLRRARVGEMVNRAIRSLNSLYFGSGGGEDNTATSVSDLPLGQRQTIASIVDAVHFLGPPPDACDPGEPIMSLRWMLVTLSCFDSTSCPYLRWGPRVWILLGQWMSQFVMWW